MSVYLATGPQPLPVFTPHGRYLYVTVACLGGDTFSLGTLFDFSGCDGTSVTMRLEGQRGLPQHLDVRVAPTTTWRLFITSGH